MFKMKEWTKTLTNVVEMTKKEYLLAITASLLGGIVVGFVFAPRRIKYTTIGSHNGSENQNNGNDNGNGNESKLQEEAEEMEE